MKKDDTFSIKNQKRHRIIFYELFHNFFTKQFVVFLQFINKNLIVQIEQNEDRMIVCVVYYWENIKNILSYDEIYKTIKNI